MKTRTELTSVSGSDNPNPEEFQIALPGEYPDEFEDASEGWKAAWDHAARHLNTPKACLLYAEAHYNDHDEGIPETEDPKVLKDEIARLEAELHNAQQQLVDKENEAKEPPKKPARKKSGEAA